MREPVRASAPALRMDGVVAESGAKQAVFSVRELAASCHRLPAAPGVYVFRDVAGEPLYVGTSRDLRARLQSYFRPSGRRSRKQRGILRAAVEVEIRRAGSEFAALLEEARLIQELAPPLNRRLKAPDRYRYLRIDHGDPFSRLEQVPDAAAGGPDSYLGPFAPHGGMARALDLVSDAFGLRTCEGAIRPDVAGRGCWRADVETCSAPCRGRTTAQAYRRSVLRALHAIAGGGRTGLSALARERDALAAAERFEAAARVQRRVAAVTQLRRVLRPVVLAQEWDHALVVQPGCHAGSVALWVIAGGRVVTHEEGEARRPEAVFGRIWRAARPQPAQQTPKRDVDAARIIHRWVRRPENRRWVIDLHTNGRAAAWTQVSRLTADLSLPLFPDGP